MTFIIILLSSMVNNKWYTVHDPMYESTKYSKIGMLLRHSIKRLRKGSKYLFL